MNDQNKTKEELIDELQKTQQNLKDLETTFESNLKVVEEERKVLEKLIDVSKAFLQFNQDRPNYQSITQTMLDVSGAKYVALNIFEDDGLDFTTVAFVGIKNHIKKGLEFLGFEIIGKHWKHDPIRAEKTKDFTITPFEHLFDLTGKSISKNVVALIEKTFNVGETFVIKVLKDDKVIGDFTLLFAKNETIKKAQFAELYANQVGMFLERYKAINHLKTSEQQFHSLFDNMREGVALHKVEFMNGKPFDYRIIDVNPKFYSIIGILREQVVGKLSTEAYGSEAPPFFTEYLDVALNKKPLFFETYFASMEKHFAISVVPWQENGFATLFTDITERKKNEEKLNKLSTAVEQSPISIVITDTNGTIEYGNKTVFSLTGYTPDEVLGKNPRIFGSSETPAKTYKELWTTILAGDIWNGEFHNKKKNGALFWEQASISAIKNDKGEITNFLAFKRDVTEFKKMLEVLEKSEEKYRLITENASDVIWLFNLRMKKFTFISPAILQLRGFTVEEAMTHDLEETVSTESAIVVHNLIEQGVQSLSQKSGESKFFINEIEQPHKDGRTVWVEISTKFRHNALGEIEVIGVSRKIDERKQFEKELRKRVSELDELNATKDKFFSIVAHDLKSPFNSIQGFSDLISEKIHNKDYSDIDKYAGYVQQSSNSAMDLLSNLMEWSHAQTGRMVFNPEYFNLVDLIENTAQLVSGPLQQKSITLLKNVSSNLPVFADKKMIGTVLRNLISNAIKFTNPEGKIQISVEKKEVEIVVAVNDTGVGISKANCEKLFRIDQSYSTVGTKNEQGTGLGLILCKEFMEKHHGAIWVESEVGKGSTFYFNIPQRL